MPRNSYLVARYLTLSFFLFAPQFALADVSALGRIEPLNGVMKISAPVVLEAGNGIVLGELHAAAGDLVDQGDLLAVTESHAVLDALKIEAEAAHFLAEKNALAANALADADCVKATVSRREADRRLSLLDQKLSSLEESERASADAEFQEASCRASRIAATASQAKVALAHAHLNLRKKTLDRASVYAPFSGRILNIVTWPGEAIGPAGILELAQTERMYAIAEIYETDIHRVKLNQVATITSNALAEPLRGVVETIRPMIRKQDVMGTDPAARKDARIVEVEIRIENAKAVEKLTNLQVEVLIES